MIEQNYKGFENFIFQRQKRFDLCNKLKTLLNIWDLPTS